MNGFIHNLNQRLSAQLNEIEHSGQNEITKARDSAQCVTNGILELKAFAIHYHFSAVSEEIHFFKEVKPKLVSSLLYHVQVFIIKSRCPAGTRIDFENYFKNELQKISLFLNSYIEFYQYYRSCCTHYDDRYFVRGKGNIILCDDCLVSIIDPAFSTSHDYLLAKMIASEQLSAYLNHQIEALAVPIQPVAIENSEVFQWTDSNTSMAELIYSLLAAKAINNGKCDTKKLVALFERMFNVKISDCYRIYVDIKNRAKPTKFIDKLKNAMLRKVEEDEA